MANAISFDGVGDRVVVGDVFGFSGTASFSVIMRAYIDSTQADTFARLISKEETSTGLGWDLEYNSGTLYFYRKTGGSDNVSQSITADTWMDIGAVYNGTNLQLYIDGTGTTPVASSRSITSHTQSLTFGRQSQFGANEISGDLYNISIWDAALSESDYLKYRGKILTGNETNLVGYWKCDEGTGTNVADSASTNDGTLTNATWITGAPDLPNLAGLIPGSLGLMGVGI